MVSSDRCPSRSFTIRHGLPYREAKSRRCSASSPKRVSSTCCSATWPGGSVQLVDPVGQIGWCRRARRVLRRAVGFAGGGSVQPGSSWPRRRRCLEAGLVRGGALGGVGFCPGGPWGRACRGQAAVLVGGLRLLLRLLLLGLVGRRPGQGESPGCCPVSRNLSVDPRSDDRLRATKTGRAVSIKLSVAGSCVTEVVAPIACKGPFKVGWGSGGGSVRRPGASRGSG